MWKIVHASAIGTAHLETELPCQDSSVTEIIRGQDDQDYLVCIVSDGAGSARYGGEGAQLTCKTAMSNIKQTLCSVLLNPLDYIVVEEWIKDIRRVIYETSDTYESMAREYACTFLGTVIGSDMAVFFQIGDGAMVVSNSCCVQGIVFWPDTGMYANMTHFLTEEDALLHLRVAIVNTRIDEIALFTDGIQSLALSFEQLTPHHLFFEPMLQKMRTSTVDECHQFNQLLAQFLSSPLVNARTNDDKTLILATRRSSV